MGLAWGDSEGKLLPSDTKDAHGIGHLPRADHTLTPQQNQLFQDAFDDSSKKVVLFTHFTFVSYKNEIANFLPAGNPEKPTFPIPGTVATSTFSKQDWGTFEKLRKPAYEKILEAKKGGSSAQCSTASHTSARHSYAFR